MAKYSKQQIIDLQKELVTDKAIGERLGISLHAAYQMRTKFKIPPVNRNQKRNEKIVRAIKNGRSINELAKKFSLQNVSIYPIISKTGLQIKKLRAKYTKQQFIGLQKELVTDAAIGERLGVSRQAVHQIRNKFGIKSNAVRKPKRNDRIVRGFNNDLSIDGMVKKFNLHFSTIYRIIKQSGLPIKNRGPWNEKAPRIIKRNDDMKAAYKKGLKGPAVAKKFGLSIPYTYKLLKIGRPRRKT